MKHDEHVPPVYGQPTAVDVNALKQNGLPPAKGPRDLAFALLYVVNFCAFLGLTIYSGNRYSKENPHTGDGNHGGHRNNGSGDFDSVVGMIMLATALTAVAAVVVACLWLVVAAKFPRQLIVGTIVTKIVMWLAAAATIAFFISRSNAESSMYLVCVGPVVGALFTACLFYMWRRRIPFAATLLATCSNVTQAHPGTWTVSFCSLVVLMLFSALWSYGTVATMGWVQNTDNSAAQYLTSVYLLFTLYFNQQVIRNTVHVTVSGVFATWYFMGGNVGLMPRHPTLGSLKRATTTSFGSICLGSLLVAALQTVRAIVRSMKTRRNALIVCLIECILGILESLMRLFNKFAFVLVAIYGMSFCEAAKQTYELIKSHGISALVNNCIVGEVLGMASLLGAIVCFGFGSLLGYVLIPFSADTYLWLFPGVGGFLFGFVAMSQVASVIDSGVTTIFVAYAMDPQQLAANDVALAQEFQATASLI